MGTFLLKKIIPSWTTRLQPPLIVVNAALIDHWQKELTKSHLSVLEVSSEEDLNEKMKDREKSDEVHVVLCAHTFYQELVEACPPSMEACDIRRSSGEQHLKNASCRRGVRLVRNLCVFLW